MLTIILVSLSVSLLAVLVVSLAAFCDVAFREPARATVPIGSKGNWQPPLVRGHALLDWAAATARSTTMEFLRYQRTEKTAAVLASELHAGTTSAIDQEGVSSREVGCPAYCHALIAVSPPEVLGIADYLRKQSRPDELLQIEDRAAENCRQLADSDSRHVMQRDIRCPLLNSEDVCCAFSARPIRCRGWCPTKEAVDDVSSSAEFGQNSFDRHDYESRGQVVVQGAESGFCSGLKESGLDGDLYELNSALVAALDAPDAAERWANGDSVFENCSVYE